MTPSTPLGSSNLKTLLQSTRCWSRTPSPYNNTPSNGSFVIDSIRHDPPVKQAIILGGLGVLDSPNSSGWPPMVCQGWAPMYQLSKSRTNNFLQAKYPTPQMPLPARPWFFQRVQNLHNASNSCYKQTSTCTNRMVFRHMTLYGWEKIKMNWIDGNMID